MSTVDIIIPLYNKASCIARAIHSIQAQTMTDWRLIVVDDGSTDEGPQIVRDFNDPRIELIQQPNAGPGAARNKGIKNATAKYIAFLDADDEWYPHYLKNAIKAIKAKKAALVATMYCLWPGQQDMTGFWARRNVRPGEYSLSPEDDPAWADLLLNFPHVWNSLMLTDVARKYDGFYEERCMLGEDTVFFLRICINETFAVVGDIGVRHHTEDSTLAQAEERPLAPFFIKPQIVLDYCPHEKHKLMSAVIDHMALRFAKDRSRRGLKAEALQLLQRFPGVKAFRWKYFSCRCALPFSRVLPYWVKVKCTIGPPARSFLRSLGRKLRLLPKLPPAHPKDSRQQDS